MVSAARHDESNHERAFLAEREPRDIGGHGLGVPHAAQAERGEVGDIDEQVDRRDGQNAVEQDADHVAPRIAHLAGEIRRLVPAAEGEQDEDHGEAKRAARACGRRLRLPAGHEAGNDENGEAREQQELHDLLHTLRLQCSGDVERGERNHADRRVDGRAVVAQAQDLGGVVPEHEGDRRDGAGLDYCHARPGENERHTASHAAGQKGVFAARIRMARSELRVDERATQRDHAAEHPRAEKLGRTRAVAGDDRRRFENAGADHHPADQDDSVRNREQLLGRYLVLVAVHG